MSIEEQIAELEARIQQAIILASGCTERAEQAAIRAEEAAARAELATVASQQAELVATLAATTATTSAAIAVEQEEQIEETIEEIEHASESLPDQRGSDSERETTESDDLLDGEREAEEGSQPPAQPIVIAIKESAPREQRLFKRNNTRFSRGRTH